MGRQKQPIDLLVYKGNKHLTKKEIEERKSKEVKAPSDKVKPPSHLHKSLRKEFNKIANELVKIGIMSNLDVDSLARFLNAQKMYITITDKLIELDPMDEAYNDLLLKQDKLFKQCRQAASDLGLTITSRCKISIPKKDETKERTEEEKLFGGNL